jgi:predicted PurR-regulated permease PerM
MTDKRSTRLRDIVVIIAGLIVIFTAVKYASDITVPFLLSLFIAVLAAAPVAWLKKKGLSPPIAIVAVLIVVVAVEILLGLMIGATVDSFTEAMPGYQERLNGLSQGAVTWLAGRGIDLKATGIMSVLDPGAVMKFANSFVTSLGKVLSNAALIMFTVLFMLIEASSIPAKLVAMSTDGNGSAARYLSKVADSVNHYMGIKALMSLATGLIVGIGVAIVGLDFAALWGFIAFLLNFVPTIGSILAAVPAVLLSLVQLGLFPTLIVIAIYLGANLLIGNVIEPTIMGRQIGLSTLVVFLSLVFWGWLLGPVGMFLSVPLTMAVKFAADASDQTRWLAILLSPAPADSNAARSDNAKGKRPRKQD